MKNDQWSKLNSYIAKQSPDLPEILGVHWNAQEVQTDQALVYTLNEGDLAENNLRVRLKTSKANLIVLNREPNFALTLPYVIARTDSWHKLQKALADIFFPFMSELKLAGITGTNGKSTTVELVIQLAAQASKNIYSIGTLGVRSSNGTSEEFGLTTPGYLQLRQLIHKYGQQADGIIMEVSSHALEQQRIYGIYFDSVAWTSFTQDHLDYHKTMEAYFAAKKKLLLHRKSKDRKMIVPASQKDILTKLGEDEAIAASLDLTKIKNLPEAFRAPFNQDNLACALAVAKELAALPMSVDWSKLSPPPGRFFTKQWNDRVVIVDFAHTPDALHNVVVAARKAYPTKKIIVLFGCGGDRDRSKRPLMAKAAGEIADQLIVTSDNPRTEDPKMIIQDILPGIPKHMEYLVEVDRPTAVRNSLKQLQAMEVLILAGKGHEDYIIYGQTKHHYSDIEEVEKFLEQL